MRFRSFQLARISGIPVTVARTYDTMRAQQSVDFGFGWRLEYGDTDLRTSVPKPELDDEVFFNPFRARRYGPPGE